MSTKVPDPIDKHVGTKVRQRRLMLGWSQEKLAGGLGLTFQQVQKYEKGMNRVGASRLRHIATLLQCEESFFFEGAPGAKRPAKFADQQVQDFTQPFLSSTWGLRMCKAFMRVSTDKQRQALVHLAESMNVAAPE